MSLASYSRASGQQTSGQVQGNSAGLEPRPFQLPFGYLQHYGLAAHGQSTGSVQGRELAAQGGAQRGADQGPGAVLSKRFSSAPAEPEHDDDHEAADEAVEHEVDHDSAQPAQQHGATAGTSAGDAQSEAGAGQGDAAKGGRSARRRGRPGGHHKHAVVTHRTLAQAPGGGHNGRTMVGVGERVRFKSTVAGTWTASAAHQGTPVHGTGTRFLWQAPVVAHAVRITFAPAHGSHQAVHFHVIHPSSLHFDRISQDGYPAGQQGVGMVTRVTFMPLNVSFSFLQWLEVPGGPSGITGYFVHHPAPDHHPNPDWLNVGPDNSHLTDHAALWGWPAPWTDGRFEWAIPNSYRVQGDGGAGHRFTTTHQRFHLEGPPHAGRTTVTKGGARAQRAP